VQETADDLAALQDLLDRSYAGAGRHLLRIHTPERRLTAEQVAERLQGMVLLALATSTGDGRPIVGPVDGVFHRGAFHFGSAPDSVRFRHIAQRPQVSATHLPGEELSVTVHGRAVPVDISSGGFRQALLDIYVPRYGEQWADEFLDTGPVYARIEAERMFTFHMPPGSSA
jgi:nitroimidazol reductase NimA-like FMN-containing flavoprotein (pyridoxamine 5'-phosphate oxidase superfamily)